MTQNQSIAIIVAVIAVVAVVAVAIAWRVPKLGSTLYGNNPS